MAYLVIWFLGYGRKRIGRRRSTEDGQRKVTMLSYVAVRYDGRIRWAATTLAEAGYDVLLIKPADAENVADVDHGWHKRVSFLSTGLSGTTTYFPYCFDTQMFRAAVKSEAHVYHCHDLNTSLMGLLAAAKTGGFIVSDMHEWSSEGGSWNNRHNRFKRLAPLKRAVYRRVERLVLQHASAIVTTSLSLAQAMREALQINRDIVIVRNVPIVEGSLNSERDLREELGLAREHFLVIYVGSLGPHRNIDKVIQALSRAPSVALAVRGMGHHIYGPIWRKLAMDYEVTDRLFVLPPVSPECIVASCRGADAGLYTVADVCLNFHYALGNKIFEYIFAGVPILAARYPEVERIVGEWGVGIMFDNDDPESIANALNAMACDRRLYSRLRRNVIRVRHELTVNPEWQKLVFLYETFSQPVGVIDRVRQDAATGG